MWRACCRGVGVARARWRDDPAPRAWLRRANPAPQSLDPRGKSRCRLCVASVGGAIAVGIAAKVVVVPGVILVFGVIHIEVRGVTFAPRHHDHHSISAAALDPQALLVRRRAPGGLIQPPEARVTISRPTRFLAIYRPAGSPLALGFFWRCLEAFGSAAAAPVPVGRATLEKLAASPAVGEGAAPRFASRAPMAAASFMAACTVLMYPVHCARVASSGTFVRMEAVKGSAWPAAGRASPPSDAATLLSRRSSACCVAIATSRSAYAWSRRAPGMSRRSSPARSLCASNCA